MNNENTDFSKKQKTHLIMTSRLLVWKDRLWRYKLEWLLMCIGITLYITGLYCLRLTGSWTEASSTYTDAQVNGFIFGLMFLSISILLMVHVLCELFWMQYPITCTASLYVSFAILSFFGCIFSFFSFEGYAYFITDNDTQFYPVLSLVSLTSVALCSVFCIICLLLLTATMKTRGFRLKLYGKSSADISHTDSASDDEEIPLLSTVKNASDELNENDVNEDDSKSNESPSAVIPYNPSSYSSDMKCSQGDRSFACYALIIIIFFILCASLPNSFSSFTPDAIFQLDSHGSSTYEIFWSFSANYGMNIYPDLLCFYCSLFCICTISYLSRKSLWFRIEMRKNKYFIMNPCMDKNAERNSNPNKNAFLIKQGEQILYVLIFLFFVLWAIYWICIYDGYENMQSDYLWLQRVTLGTGKLSMLSLSLCLFPVSKNTNLWNVIFSTSYEHLLVYHKFFAYLFVLLSTLHLILWLVYFAISGQLWNNIIFASLPYSYSVSNFTVAVMYYWYLFLLLPIFVILSHSKVRNFHYEWFYFSHLFGTFVCVSMVVYHANSSWYYIIPPVILYVIDQLVSIYNRSLSIATITDVEQLSHSPFIKFTIAVHNTVQNNEHDNYFGKYFLVNIPEISKYEWHPLTVSNMQVNENETEYEFIVSNNGDWTAKICDFGSNSSLVGSVVRLDGMYGEPIISDAYRKVLIICDGIGFISYIAFFQHMLHRAIRDESQLSVDLVWICDSPQILVHFAPMLKLYSNKFDADPERLFDVRVFFTNTGISDHERNEIESEIHLTLEEGSPNLMRELSYIQGLGTFTLILANGSSALLNETRKIAVNFSAHYREERTSY